MMPNNFASTISKNTCREGSYIFGERGRYNLWAFFDPFFNLAGLQIHPNFISAEYEFCCFVIFASLRSQGSAREALPVSPSPQHHKDEMLSVWHYTPFAHAETTGTIQLRGPWEIHRRLKKLVSITKFRDFLNKFCWPLTIREIASRYLTAKKDKNVARSWVCDVMTRMTYQASKIYCQSHGGTDRGSFYLIPIAETTNKILKRQHPNGQWC